MGLQLPRRLLVRAGVAGPYRHEQRADLSGLSVLAELGRHAPRDHHARIDCPGLEILKLQGQVSQAPAAQLGQVARLAVAGRARMHVNQPVGQQGLQCGDIAAQQCLAACMLGVQDSLQEWTHTIPRQIAYISTFIPLSPGDVIVTGTPGGVGNKRNPQVFMKPGDVCEIVVDAIGTLRNGIRDDA